MTEPSSTGIGRNLLCRPAYRLRDDADACLLVGVIDLERPIALLAREGRLPPPGRIPSAAAARVAWTALRMRSFFSLTSISLAPPTRTTAMPLESRASRSSSFSRS